MTVRIASDRTQGAAGTATGPGLGLGSNPATAAADRPLSGRGNVGRPCQHGIRRQCRMFRIGNRKHPREREPRTDLLCVMHGL